MFWRDTFFVQVRFSHAYKVHFIQRIIVIVIGSSEAVDMRSGSFFLPSRHVGHLFWAGSTTEGIW